jgi:hypothetical protein
MDSAISNYTELYSCNQNKHFGTDNCVSVIELLIVLWP